METQVETLVVQQIESDYLHAYRTQSEERVSVLRMLKAELQKAVKANKNQPLKEDQALTVVSKFVAQATNAGDIYKGMGEHERASQEYYAATVAQKYLPVQMTNEEIESAVRSIISENEFSGLQHMGKTMGLFKASFPNRADGKVVIEIVKAVLAG